MRSHGKSTAQRMMREGIKMTHIYFTDEEYMWVENGQFKDENGNHIDWNEFWHYRQDDAFMDGWSEYKEVSK